VPGLLEDICINARRANASITLSVEEGLVVTLRVGGDAPGADQFASTMPRRHGSHIWVAAQLRRAAAAINIDDDGPGIPEAQRETLLKPFESNAPGGTGLGLAIARDIIVAAWRHDFVLDRPLGGLRVAIELPG
jgi:two-component system osmolarity sensor histidine kinase EnvZ